MHPTRLVEFLHVVRFLKSSNAWNLQTRCSFTKKAVKTSGDDQVEERFWLFSLITAPNIGNVGYVEASRVWPSSGAANAVFFFLRCLYTANGHMSYRVPFWSYLPSRIKTIRTTRRKTRLERAPDLEVWRGTHEPHLISTSLLQ